MSINRRLAIALSAALLLAGCGEAGRTGSGTTPVTTTPPVTAPVTPTGPETTGTRQPDGPGQAVTVRRSGGFAGVQDTVTVAPDGSWTSTDRNGARRTGTLGAAETAQLRVLLDDPRLATEARAVPGTGSRCSDAFTYQVTVGSLRIAYEQCPADEPPPPLAAAIADLVNSAAGL